jgi:hypothetical protein
MVRATRTTATPPPAPALAPQHLGLIEPDAHPFEAHWLLHLRPAPGGPGPIEPNPPPAFTA